MYPVPPSVFSGLSIMFALSVFLKFMCVCGRFGCGRVGRGGGDGDLG